MNNSKKQQDTTATITAIEVSADANCLDTLVNAYLESKGTQPSADAKRVALLQITHGAGMLTLDGMQVALPENMRFVRNKKMADGLSILRVDGAYMSACGTVAELLASTALLKAPAGVPHDRYLIIQIKGGTADQEGHVYRTRDNARTAMLQQALQAASGEGR